MTFTFDSSIPASANNPSNDQPIMLTNNIASEGIIAVDHIGYNVAGGGQHKEVTFNNDPARGYPFTPAVPTSPPVLFAKDNAANIPQLFWYSGSGAVGSTQYSEAANFGTFLL